jgi:hypothetical protein
MTKKQLEDALDVAMTPYLKAFLMNPKVASFKTRVEQGTAKGEFIVHADDYARLIGTDLAELFTTAFNKLSEDLDSAKGTAGVALLRPA